MITQAPRGTKDWFGKDMATRSYIEKLAKKIAESYNFSQIITPAFEHTNLFERGVGDSTDIVQKEMYTFTDKGGRMISLKPEGTSPVIRAFLEHSMFQEPSPKKLFYFTQAFRYEKPASGRLRQHHQFGCELIGSVSPLAELEVISLVSDFIEKIGLKNIKLHINSIGQGDCRKRYVTELIEFLTSKKDGLCKVCKERMDKNPLRVIDCKEEGCKNIVKDAPRIIDFLDEACKKHMEELKSLLDANNIDYIIDTGIVRGLDYYTNTVFEFIDEDGFTLCGGGRYDKLISEIDTKQDIPAVGFGMGIERIMYFLEKQNIKLDIDKRIDLYLGVLGDNKAETYKIAHELRNKGFVVELDIMERSLRAQMKYANKLNAKYTAIIGDNELSTGEVSLKNMDTGEESIVRINDIYKYLGGKDE